MISAAFFAIARPRSSSGSRLVLVMSLALALAVAGFLPFNLRPGRRALAWMGDSGSQLIGFTLAALGLASSYTVATSTVATLVLPVLVLAVPILDTTLVTIVRLLDGRPVSQGGRDHSSHRLVSLGVSETGAVVLLALVSAALGATSLAYEAFGSGRIAALGVLVTFALLVQFGSFLADVDRSRTGPARLYLYTRRLAEVVVDGALIAASFLAAYLLRFDGIGTPNQRHYFLLTLPVLLFCRYVGAAADSACTRASGATRARATRCAQRSPVGVSEVVALGIVVLTQGDARRLLAQRLRDRRADLHGRDHRRALRRARDRPRHRARTQRRGPARPDRRRGPHGTQHAARAARDAGRARRRLRRRRPAAARPAAERRSRRRQRRRASTSVLDRTRPDIVFVTIPNAPKERLDEIVRACAAREIDCRFVRREIDVDPRVILGVDR